MQSFTVIKSGTGIRPAAKRRQGWCGHRLAAFRA
jgi:hypothetical protein